MSYHDDLIVTLNESVLDVFQTTMALSAEVLDDTISPVEESLICSIGIAGSLEGTVSIYMSEKIACEIVSKMLYMEIEELNSDVKDGIGELLNMIAGGMKNRIGGPDKEHPFDISIPTTVRGKKIVKSNSQGKTIEILKKYKVDNIEILAILDYKLNTAKVDEASTSALDKLTALDASGDSSSLELKKDEKNIVDTPIISNNQNVSSERKFSDMEIQEALKDALREAVVDTFSATLTLSVEETDEKILPSADEGIVSSIGVTGKVEGNIAACLSSKAACLIVSKMLYMDIEEVDSDVTDGVGELINMIAGGAKTKLGGAEGAYGFDISIPSTVMGVDLEFSGDTEKTSNLEMNFKCEDFQFLIIFTYKVMESSEGSAAQTPVNDSKLQALDALSKIAPTDEKSVQAKEANADPLAMLQNAVNDSNKAPGNSTEDSKEEKSDPLTALQNALDESKTKSDDEPLNKSDEDRDPLEALNKAVEAAQPEKSDSNDTSLEDKSNEVNRLDELKTVNDSVAQKANNEEEEKKESKITLKIVTVSAKDAAKKLDDAMKKIKTFEA